MKPEKVILLVEDNPDDVELTIRALQKSRILNEVVVVGDGVEGLDFLHGRGDFAGRDLSVTPQVILLDLNMPVMNGREFLEAAQRDRIAPEVPVIMLAATRPLAMIQAKGPRAAKMISRVEENTATRTKMAGSSRSLMSR